MKCLESLHVQALHKALQTHQDRKARPARMLPHRDKLSQAWLTALPGPLTHIPSPEFTQAAMAWHLLTPSPACQPHLGKMICGKPLDQFGETLMCATLPFNSWRVRHDKVKMEIQSLGLESGLIVNTKPFGLFSHLIPANAYLETGQLHHHRERQGLISDFLVASPSDHGHQAAQLCELKLISAGATYYKSGNGDRSVDVRARQLPRIYQDKAKNIDRVYCGTTEGQVGPVQCRLEQFGELAGFVIGQFCKGSHDLHQYLIKCENEKTKRQARASGSSVSDFKSQILQQLRRRLFVCSINTRHAIVLSAFTLGSHGGHSQGRG